MTEILEKTSLKTLTQTPEQQKERKDVGALWFKKDETSGDEWFTGEITLNGTKHQLTVRRNKYKDKESKPDWRIYLWNGSKS